HRLGKRQLIVELEKAVDTIPAPLSPWGLELSAEGSRLVYTYDPRNTHTGVAELLRAIDDAGLLLKDLVTSKSSLEEIFINLVDSKA
ncbi:MAG: multidrug ABC transporter ATP-binding protein, partial [Pseudomonadota bacterium]